MLIFLSGIHLFRERRALFNLHVSNFTQVRYFHSISIYTSLNMKVLPFVDLSLKWYIYKKQNSIYIMSVLDPDSDHPQNIIDSWAQVPLLSTLPILGHSTTDRRQNLSVDAIITVLLWRQTAFIKANPQMTLQSHDAMLLLHNTAGVMVWISTHEHAT